MKALSDDLVQLESTYHLENVVKTEHKFLMEGLSIHDPKCSNKQIRNEFH